MTLQNLSESDQADQAERAALANLAIETFSLIELTYEQEKSQSMLDLVNRALVKKALLHCEQGEAGHEAEMAAFRKLDDRLNAYRP